MGTHRQADVYVWAHTDSERTLFGRIEELLQLIPLVFAYLLQVRVPFLVLGFRFKGLDWVYAYLLKYVYLSCSASTRCPRANTPTLYRTYSHALSPSHSKKGRTRMLGLGWRI